MSILQGPNVNDPLEAIRAITLKAMSKTGKPGDCTNMGLSAMMGAAEPLMETMFSGGSYIDRLRFLSLLLIEGASFEDRGDELAVTMRVDQDTIGAAIKAFKATTGRSIEQYLPPRMVEFAKESVN